MTNRRRRGSAGLVLSAGVLAAILVACSTHPMGLPFTEALPPGPEHARIYVYRLDPLVSVSPIRLTVDGRPFGVLRHGEYERIDLPPGLHDIKAGIRSVAFVTWGWNDVRLHVGPGETAYLKISARLTERSQPAGRALDIAGRTSGAVSENVFLQPMGASEARADLAGTTRMVPSPHPPSGPAP